MELPELSSDEKARILRKKLHQSFDDIDAESPNSAAEGVAAKRVKPDELETSKTGNH